jgi:putative endonuclease
MFVYVLKSQRDGSFYIGVTDNIKQRIDFHNKGYNLSTKAKRPWLLLRSEEYKDCSLALKREKFLKSGKGRCILKNICP